MRLGIQAICDRGLLRDRNEDALSVNGLFLRDDAVELSVDIPEEGFFYLLVSDGMGGHEKGEEASRFAQEEMEEQLMIAFNPFLLIETLKAFDSKNVRLQLAGTRHPMIVESEDSDFKAAVLPVAI